MLLKVQENVLYIKGNYQINMLIRGELKKAVLAISALLCVGSSVIWILLLDFSLFFAIIRRYYLLNELNSSLIGR